MQSSRKSKCKGPGVCMCWGTWRCGWSRWRGRNESDLTPGLHHEASWMYSESKRGTRGS